MNFKRFISMILCVLMLISCMLPIISCNNETNEKSEKDNCSQHVDENKDGKCDKCGEAVSSDTECKDHKDTNSDGKCDNCGEKVEAQTPDGKIKYTVKVETTGGMPLKDVFVVVYKGTAMADYKFTDNNGLAVLELEASNDYTIKLEGVPDGYTVKGGETPEDRYPMAQNGALIQLSSSPIKGEGYADSYKLGDIMNDFTLTDVKGNEYNLSSLINESGKRAVVLNFWYVDCTWCLKEFPSINASYKKYSDLVEVLAVNDYTSDSFNDVVYFPTTGTFEGEENNLVFPFFKENKTTDNLILDKFEPDASKRGYPTTVIIDRYGMICMIESGAIVGEEKWDQIFDYFTSDEYEQKIIENAEDLTPPVVPDIKWDENSEAEISENFNGSDDLLVEYAPETNEKDAPYSWPFIAETVDGISVVRPSNTYNNSYAIMYANIQLKPGQAVMFDYFSSCEYGNDNLIVLVDKKDICTLTGVNGGSVSNLSDWEKCCAYVDPRPITASNKDDLVTYSIGFVYQKNSDTSEGDDTVYLKNLRVVPVEDIPVETYIFRYAATDPTKTNDGYQTYVDYMLGSDGYYHVRTIDGKEGPLLLANFLSYTNFDSQKSMSQRITEKGEFIVNSVDKYNYWMIYANASSNSEINGYTPVTAELKEFLDAYCNTYRRDAGKSDHEDLWLQMCIYYDAYGLDKDGNPAKPVGDPIKGLTTFSAYETEFNDPEVNETVRYTVTYDRVIMPRGLLYKFVPAVSGVYRVTSFSDQEVTGWIFSGSSYDWADLGEGERILLTSSEAEERLCPELIYEDSHGNLVRDMDNVSLVAYMEAGKEYYIDIAYYDLYATGSFDFEIKYVGDTFNTFVMASPGPITYLENSSGGMGQLIAIGIDYDYKVDPADGIEYVYHVVKRDSEGNVVTWGSKLYADFHYPTIPFPSQSIVEITELGAFDFSLSELDVDAIEFLSTIRTYGKNYTVAKWVGEGNKQAEELWNSKNMDALLKLVQSGKDTSSYPAEDVKAAEEAIREGTYRLKTDWGKDNIGNENWIEYDMDNAIRGILSNDEKTREFQDQAIADIEETWTKTYHMDDVAAGIYHGEGSDMTAIAEKYIALMENSPETAPERQGCVALTRELSELLSQLYTKYVFEDVLHDFLKFCFYYDQLGTY